MSPSVFSFCCWRGIRTDGPHCFGLACISFILLMEKLRKLKLVLLCSPRYRNLSNCKESHYPAPNECLKFVTHVSFQIMMTFAEMIRSHGLSLYKCNNYQVIINLLSFRNFSLHTSVLWWFGDFGLGISAKI